ncbi:hypothetical protein [Candidatus Poriferisodalis sp.]|uniref:hypothetical protein n=1 Tax=Candidatus Poriferisodalis sp. TaxID=3101277 RepID=UPI003B02ACE0
MSLVPRELPPDLVTEGFVVSELARFVTKEHFDAESARFMTKEHFDAVMARWAQDAADQREAERNERVAQRELDRKERDAQREADRERLDAQRAEDRRYVDVRMERLERRLRRVQYMLPLELAAGAAGLVVVLQWLDGGG